MRAVVRLVVTFFSGAPLLRWVGATAFASMLTGAVALYVDPSLLRRSLLVWVGPIVGTGGLLLSGALMPLMFWHYSQSRHLNVLPHGRLKLLASALGTVLLVASATAATVAVILRASFELDLGTVFAKTLVVCILSDTVVYLVLGFVANSRSAIAVLCGTIIMIPGIVVPLAFVQRPWSSLRVPLIICAICWAVFIASFVQLPRLKRAFHGLATNGRWHGLGLPPAHFAISGRAFDVMLGTGRPWALALGQMFPILLATFFISEPKTWLYYLTIFGAISGALSATAASRTRAIWLRVLLSRADLYREVETAFWRQNCYTASVLMALFVIIGSWMALPTSVLAFGIPLLVLGIFLGTALGLMMTGHVGVFDSILAIGTMALLMITAAYAANPENNGYLLIALESLLAGAGLAFRLFARHRWSRIDWMMYRPNPGMSRRLSV